MKVKMNQDKRWR